MPPRRPPPLPQILFDPEGPLAPGSAPLPPSPSTVHPSHIIDAHAFLSDPSIDLFYGLAPDAPKPRISSVVQVKLDISAPSPKVPAGALTSVIHPTILNLTLKTPPSITNLSRGAVDIVIPATTPMGEKEWELLEEAVVALDETWGPVEQSAKGRLVISGLLPPPLSQPSSQLIHSEVYGLHLARLASLSLHANVYLKALPPIVEAADPERSWWTDKRELERVLRMYLSPAIETFGTHRLIFGTCPTLPIPQLATITPSPVKLEQPLSSDEWYATLRKCVSELGENEDEISAIMAGNAAAVYSLV
ncbi:hypothetical protein P7C73_g5623, partial [Tremellales sp. Uapishka_1]